jgi:DNA-directed RNA polymerase specialized sigma24 family protein
VSDAANKTRRPCFERRPWFSALAQIIRQAAEESADEAAARFVANASSNLDEDFVQELWIRLTRARDDIRSGSLRVDDAEAFVGSLVARLRIDAKRVKRRIEALRRTLLAAREGAAPAAEGLVATREAAEQALNRLRRLPAPLGRVLLMRSVDDLSCREIAKILGFEESRLSEKRVADYVRRGRAALRSSVDWSANSGPS